MSALFAEYPRRKLTAREVLAMLEAGILSDDEPVELLDGELVVVSPQGNVHATLTVGLRRALEAAYGQLGFVRDHSPIDAGPYSMPEPDLCVVRGDWRDFYGRPHPNGADILLAIEIAWSSQSVDRRKASIYAAAGVTPYWIVDVPERRVEVRTEPRDGEYGTTRILDAGAELELPELDVTMRIADYLPAEG